MRAQGYVARLPVLTAHTRKTPPSRSLLSHSFTVVEGHKIGTSEMGPHPRLSVKQGDPRPLGTRGP